MTIRDNSRPAETRPVFGNDKLAKRKEERMGTVLRRTALISLYIGTADSPDKAPIGKVLSDDLAAFASTVAAADKTTGWTGDGQATIPATPAMTA
jgi:hypothetical protein